MEREGREEPKLGRDAFVNGLPLQEMRRKDSQTEMRGCGRLATSIARLEQSMLGGHGQWICEDSRPSDMK
jgi:hypothetical protein